MTNEQIKARLNAIRKTAESLHGGGYSYDSGAPSEACHDVRWLLAHIDGLNLALNDAKVRLRVLGDSLGIERWLGQHKYRTVMHRHDGSWRAVDEATQLRLDADTFEELAEMLATLADGHKLTMAKPPNEHAMGTPGGYEGEFKCELAASDAVDYYRANQERIDQEIQQALDEVRSRAERQQALKALASDPVFVREQQLEKARRAEARWTTKLKRALSKCKHYARTVKRLEKQIVKLTTGQELLAAKRQ